MVKSRGRGSARAHVRPFRFKPFSIRKEGCLDLGKELWEKRGGGHG